MKTLYIGYIFVFPINRVMMKFYYWTTKSMSSDHVITQARETYSFGTACRLQIVFQCYVYSLSCLSYIYIYHSVLINYDSGATVANLIISNNLLNNMCRIASTARIINIHILYEGVSYGLLGLYIWAPCLHYTGHGVLNMACNS